MRLGHSIDRVYVVDESNRAFQQLRSVRMSVTILRVTRRRMQCSCRHFPFAGSLIVHGHFAGHARFASCKQATKVIGNSNMTPGSTSFRLALKKNLAIETVGEDVKGRLGAVGQFIVTGGIEKVQPPGQLFILILDLLEVGHGAALEDGGGSEHDVVPHGIA